MQILLSDVSLTSRTVASPLLLSQKFESLENPMQSEGMQGNHVSDLLVLKVNINMAKRANKLRK